MTTILPTVRDQLQHAADEYAHEGSVSPARARFRANPGAIVAACCVLLALAVAVLAVSLLRHHTITANPPATHPAPTRLVLRGDGIGDIRFGQTPTAAVHGVEQLLGLGRPAQVSPPSPIGYTHFGCGFDQVYWTGLAQTPTRFSHSTGLTLEFERSRFVGYTYGSPSGGSTTPLVRRGPRFATAAGLGLREPVRRARQIYGDELVVYSMLQGTPPNPRLDRLPAWEAQTASGRIYGYIENPAGSNSTIGATIGTIDAGKVPNTPCR